MRKNKQAPGPTLSFDAMLLRASLNTGETIALREIAERIHGRCSPATLLRMTRAAMILLARRQISLCRTGRVVTQVRCTDRGIYKYMQLDACVYLMVCAAVRSSIKHEET